MFVSQPDHVTCPHAQSQNNNAIAETLPDMHAGSLIIMMLIFTLIVLTDIHQMKNLFWNRNMKRLPSLFNHLHEERREWTCKTIDISQAAREKIKDMEKLIFLLLSDHVTRPHVQSQWK